jgi:periplasmic divalent cation tolerance protein
MSHAADLVLVYSTFPDLATAERIAAEVVAERLAACANLTPGMRSVYAWRGAVERAEEVAAIFKTREGTAGRLMAEIKARHPYETPALVVLPVLAVDAGYAEWLLAETAEASGAG